MSPTFSQAVASAMDGHTAQSWNALPNWRRAELIYAAMRRIDAEGAEERSPPEKAGA